MKRTTIVLDVLIVVLVLFIATAAFEAQTGDQSGRPAGIGAANAMGFKDHAQYLTVKHVSDNLSISAETLRTEMVDNNRSLGDAIKKLRPELSSDTIRAEVKKAEAASKKAEADVRPLEPMDHLPTRLPTN